MFRFPIKPLTYQELNIIANPQIAGQPEVYPHVLYDTQIFTTASTTELNFFQTSQSNPSLGNLGASGQVPDPNYFHLFGLCLDIYILPSVTSAGSAPAGALSDMAKLLLGDAVTTGAEAPGITLNKNGKLYGPIPLTFIHGSGGAVGNGWGTETTATTGQYANNSVFDGGFPYNGSIVLAPRETFLWTIRWGGTVAITASPVAFRLSMVGNYYRKVS